MGFDRRDIRPSMDVYTRDNVYLGTVRAIVPGPVPPREEPLPPVVYRPSATSGELLGPAPTQGLGNRGPRSQAPDTGYAAHPDDASPLGHGVLEVGRWSGPLGRIGRHTIPMGAVHAVSLERVILGLTRDELTNGAPGAGA